MPQIEKSYLSRPFPPQVGMAAFIGLRALVKAVRRGDHVSEALANAEAIIAARETGVLPTVADPAHVTIGTIAVSDPVQVNE